MWWNLQMSFRDYTWSCWNLTINYELGCIVTLMALTTYSLFLTVLCKSLDPTLISLYIVRKMGNRYSCQSSKRESTQPHMHGIRLRRYSKLAMSVNDCPAIEPQCAPPLTIWQLGYASTWWMEGKKRVSTILISLKCDIWYNHSTAWTLLGRFSCHFFK